MAQGNSAFGYEGLPTYAQVGRGSWPGPVVGTLCAAGLANTSPLALANDHIKMPFRGIHQLRSDQTDGGGKALFVGFSASFYSATDAAGVYRIGIGPHTTGGSPAYKGGNNNFITLTLGTGNLQACWGMGWEVSSTSAGAGVVGVSIAPFDLTDNPAATTTSRDNLILDATNDCIILDPATLTDISIVSLQVYFIPLTHINSSPADD